MAARKTSLLRRALPPPSCQKLVCQYAPSDPRAPVATPVPQTTETAGPADPARSAPIASLTTVIDRPNPRSAIAAAKRAKSSGQSAPAMLNPPATSISAATSPIASASRTARSISASAAASLAAP